MSTAAALGAAKKELRSALKTKLSSIPPSSLDEQGSTIFTQLTQHQAYVNAKRISVYLSMPHGEVRTAPIVRDAFARGKAVFVPYLHRADADAAAQQPRAPKRVMDMIRLRDLQDFESLEKDGWGIPSIGAEIAVGRERILGDSHVREGLGLDLVLMPGVAFGLDGDGGAVQRLGHGKGFYDFFLHRYREAYGRRKADNMYLYGLALKEQFLDDKEGQIPVGAHDSPLDGVIIGDGRVLDIRRS